MFDIFVHDVKCVQINLLTYLSHTVAYEELLNDHKLEGKIFLPLDVVVAHLLTLVDQATIVKTSLL